MQSKHLNAEVNHFRVSRCSASLSIGWSHYAFHRFHSDPINWEATITTPTSHYVWQTIWTWIFPQNNVGFDGFLFFWIYFQSKLNEWFSMNRNFCVFFSRSICFVNIFWVYGNLLVDHALNVNSDDRIVVSSKLTVHTQFGTHSRRNFKCERKRCVLKAKPKK